jgi:hypothetical protein
VGSEGEHCKWTPPWLALCQQRVLRLWKLRLKAGDKVTVDFGVPAPNDFRAYLFAADLNDSTFEKAGPIVCRYIGLTGRAELTSRPLTAALPARIQLA